MLTLLWAYLAGLLTLINPCVLPLLPITIAAALQRSRHGPLALAAGLVVSFTVVGVGVTAFGHSIGLDAELINRAAAILMIAFGLLILAPGSERLLAVVSAPLADRASARIGQVEGAGSGSQFLVGVLLGAVWSPCIGPTLGGAVSLAASGEDLGRATLIMIVFGIGVATVILGLAYGSRGVVNARRERLRALSPWAKPIMGAVLLLVGVAIFFHLERIVEAWLLDILPIWLQDLSVSL